MKMDVWSVLISSLHDWGPGQYAEEVPHQLPGVNLQEWHGLIHHDYDFVDHMMIDSETIGGD
ncbi:MAG: hypothetical protein KGL39_00860 [Patescibacteria group bacterium]|nr:hypothetical protein [Patescibacteria group bacterium]